MRFLEVWRFRQLLEVWLAWKGVDMMRKFLFCCYVLNSLSNATIRVVFEPEMRFLEVQRLCQLLEVWLARNGVGMMREHMKSIGNQYL
ncbi:hypothetical protein KC19_2G232800 [Ceratodon purpureus]|uniref:Uncharacterized protein n=1 Tax=Ceratodon purpureus TaxID=3225 RepID=A0A8T0IYE5_CERPU|nr:hypothetical protein KC19_2G232800 [Ceratodon purpureus]